MYAIFQEHKKQKKDKKIRYIYEHNEFSNQYHSSKIGRNEPCPCGSNLKYKRCCLSKNI